MGYEYVQQLQSINSNDCVHETSRSFVVYENTRRKQYLVCGKMMGMILRMIRSTQLVHTTNIRNSHRTVHARPNAHSTAALPAVLRASQHAFNPAMIRPSTYNCTVLAAILHYRNVHECHTILVRTLNSPTVRSDSPAANSRETDKYEPFGRLVHHARSLVSSRVPLCTSTRSCLRDDTFVQRCTYSSCSQRCLVNPASSSIYPDRQPLLRCVPP